MMTPAKAVIAVADALNGLEFPYMLVGSFSTTWYGRLDLSSNVNFVVEPSGGKFEAIAHRLGPRFRHEPQSAFETTSGILFDALAVVDIPFWIDFFRLSNDLHDQERFRRRRRASLFGRPVWFPAAEDVIITKLRWASIGNRPKDREDARDVIAVQDVESTLDWGYIHHWCDRHGTRDLLDEVRRSIPPI